MVIALILPERAAATEESIGRMASKPFNDPAIAEQPLVA